MSTSCQLIWLNVLFEFAADSSLHGVTRLPRSRFLDDQFYLTRPGVIKRVQGGREKGRVSQREYYQSWRVKESNRYKDATFHLQILHHKTHTITPHRTTLQHTAPHRTTRHHTTTHRTTSQPTAPHVASLRVTMKCRNAAPYQLL